MGLVFILRKTLEKNAPSATNTAATMSTALTVIPHERINTGLKEQIKPSGQLPMIDTLTATAAAGATPVTPTQAAPEPVVEDEGDANEIAPAEAKQLRTVTGPETTSKEPSHTAVASPGTPKG